MFIGKDDHPELQSEAEKYFNHPNQDWRLQAMRTIGLWLKVPEYRERFRALIDSEKDEDIRGEAILDWGAYYQCTKDPEVMNVFARIFSDMNESFSDRVQAWDSFRFVAGAPLALRDMTDEEFDTDDFVDWEAVKTLLGRDPRE